ncbi:hypothetical protein [Clostridium sp.]|uniref:hypothetical protein n=1 Tax=Clostridium sp. TaxID=1506 RepID=UPI00399590F1
MYILYTTSQQQREDNKREERLFMQLDKFGDSLDNFNTTLIKSDTRLEAIKRG